MPCLTPYLGLSSGFLSRFLHHPGFLLPLTWHSPALPYNGLGLWPSFRPLFRYLLACSVRHVQRFGARSVRCARRLLGSAHVRWSPVRRSVCQVSAAPRVGFGMLACQASAAPHRSCDDHPCSGTSLGVLLQNGRRASFRCPSLSGSFLLFAIRQQYQALPP